MANSTVSRFPLPPVFYFNDETRKKAGVAFPKTWDELMAAGKTFESKLGKQYFPVVLEHRIPWRC